MDSASSGIGTIVEGGNRAATLDWINTDRHYSTPCHDFFKTLRIMYELDIFDSLRDDSSAKSIPLPHTHEKPLEHDKGSSSSVCLQSQQCRQDAH